ncbi:hypothetical protein ACP70R_001193 [Stipagrostis hirtigluma subsp. patula]
MGSDPGNTPLSPTEKSISPPPEKRQKRLSDKAGEHGQSSECGTQIVPYKDDKSDREQDEQGENHFSVVPSKPPKRAPMPIGTYAVQCAKCSKYRIVPTKEKYEEFRAQAEANPFVCEKALEWKPDVTCDDPSDLNPDGTRLWAIDKPNIAQAPPGWERLIKLRGEGSTRFADVYYITPDRKTLRSSKEIEKYLADNPQYAAEGVTLSQFSFKIPAPLQEDYVKKRPKVSQSDSVDTGSTESLQPEEEQPIACAAPPAPDDPRDEQRQLVLYDEGLPEPVQSEPPEPETKPGSPPPPPADAL